MKVISGGQTGVDISALRAAKKVNLETGGFAPPQFMTIDGPEPELGSVYGLAEANTAGGAAGYILRSQMNSNAASAVIAVYVKESAGTGKTIEYTKNGKWPNTQPPRITNGSMFVEVEDSRKPLLVIYDIEAQPDKVVAAIQCFLRKHAPKTVNVCGNRDFDEVMDFEGDVEKIFVRAFQPFKKPETN
jgi:hypothetical protein